ncbi:proline-rich protein HaeIII subfamily 1-like [Pezoporus flaviventris]|uniref:proline-rich protein HaeIII subfamily 1-like n=1 Tax=Pezoporus flaviventris TaxID=889875 RepID=UPI002AB0E956|nr:proline-rich protein HaeIII subfamily 1-like [Pezoporus flaviventris]
MASPGAAAAPPNKAALPLRRARPPAPAAPGRQPRQNAAPAAKGLRARPPIGRRGAAGPGRGREAPPPPPGPCLAQRSLTKAPVQPLSPPLRSSASPEKECGEPRGGPPEPGRGQGEVGREKPGRKRKYWRRGAGKKRCGAPPRAQPRRRHLPEQGKSGRGRGEGIGGVWRRRRREKNCFAGTDGRSAQGLSLSDAKATAILMQNKQRAQHCARPTTFPPPPAPPSPPGEQGQIKTEGAARFAVRH